MSPPIRRDPAFLRYYARVLLREARLRRGTEFSRFLLMCAARARRESCQPPMQGELFG